MRRTNDEIRAEFQRLLIDGDPASVTVARDLLFEHEWTLAKVSETGVRRAAVVVQDATAGRFDVTTDNRWGAYWSTYSVKERDQITPFRGCAAFRLNGQSMNSHAWFRSFRKKRDAIAWAKREHDHRSNDHRRTDPRLDPRSAGAARANSGPLRGDPQRSGRVVIGRVLTLSLTLSLAACTDPDVEVRRTFALAGPNGADLPSHARGEGWRAAGVVEVEIDAADVVVVVEIVPGLIEATGTAGRAQLETNQIFLDDRIAHGPATVQYGALVAHEIGHVVLDTSIHTSCGIMANADLLPCEEDMELADVCLTEGCD